MAVTDIASGVPGCGLGEHVLAFNQSVLATTWVERTVGLNNELVDAMKRVVGTNAFRPTLGSIHAQVTCFDFLRTVYRMDVLVEQR